MVEEELVKGWHIYIYIYKFNERTEGVVSDNVSSNNFWYQHYILFHSSHGYIEHDTWFFISCRLKQKKNDSLELDYIMTNIKVYGFINL